MQCVVDNILCFSLQAREAGKSQGKWLMINIQNVQEFSCQALNRDVWSKDAVKALIKDNFIFWQVNLSVMHSFRT